MDGSLQESQLSTTEQKLQKEPPPGIVAIFVEQVASSLDERSDIRVSASAHKT
jgi:hypothetical protein